MISCKEGTPEPVGIFSCGTHRLAPVGLSLSWHPWPPDSATYQPSLRHSCDSAARRLPGAHAVAITAMTVIVASRATIFTSRYFMSRLHQSNGLFRNPPVVGAFQGAPSATGACRAQPRRHRHVPLGLCDPGALAQPWPAAGQHHWSASARPRLMVRHSFVIQFALDPLDG